MNENEKKYPPSSLFDDEFDGKIKLEIKKILLENNVSPEKWEEFQPSIKFALDSAFLESSKDIINELHADQEHLLIEKKLEQKKFSQEIHDRWGKALDFLEAYIHASLEIGDAFNAKHRSLKNIEQCYTIEVITRLHGRACQIAQEILILLKHGFPDGAFARWRTLHEIAVLSQIVITHGEEIAKLYYLHEIYLSKNAMTNYNKYLQKYPDKLFDRRYSDEEFIKIQLQIDKLQKTHQDYFPQPYGWAAGLIIQNYPNKTKFSFSDLEELVGQDFMRPYYKMASYFVHGEIKGLTASLSKGFANVIPAGPSIFHFIEPGQNTAISLLKINATILSLEQSMQSRLIYTIFDELCDEICKEFIAVEFDMKNRRRNYLENE